MKKIVTTALALCLAMSASAQRVVDKLDRGLVAVKTANGVFCSWRILGEEYYDVNYNIYRDGVKLNSEPLSVSNYTDALGSPTSKYTVRAVVRGTEQAASSEVTPLTTNYKEIPIATIPSNADGSDIKGYYEPNDAIIADLDGDGEMEILLKLRNTNDAANSYPNDATDFDVIQIYKLNGKLLWWIDCGRNMTDFQSNEINIAAYDWDGDGKAECVLRGADGMVIHKADGDTTIVGDPTVNTRPDLVHGSGTVFTHTGAEYLIYLNGETGETYSISEYPLKRLEDGETDLKKAWGDGYGHRSSKNFFGAPYLDGRKPSIFLARGIYTRHKMVAFDVDPKTHKLTERWRWNCNTPGSPWYGQGYHNYTIADVDCDGRDEIVFGSMVIDDNGKGLSTTGLGHGDAHHVGDLNPFIHGLEVMACNEDLPSNNYRDATTSKIYYRKTGGSDDGRAIAGNFSNDYPGAMFISAHDSDSPVSCVADKHIDGATTTGMSQNFRIYWDGDLLEETFNGSESRNSAGVINKYGVGRIESFGGTRTNNDTKSTPCLQGDIFGDWREEVVMRSSDNKSIRIYTTTAPTVYRNYTLLHDPQYRNAMITQMNGYNQPPHVSYFLGDLEDITMAPPAPIMTNKQEVKDGGSVSTSLNDKQVILAETKDATVSITDGASPYIFFDNAPTWVQGHDDNDNIEYTTYTHTLTGGAFGGQTRIVKLGDGALTLPSVVQRHTGTTEVWAGTLNFDGTMQNSKVWLNRHTTLKSKGGKFLKGIEANYGAVIKIDGTLETDSLKMNYGSAVEFDITADGKADQLTAGTLTIGKKDWKYGPQYSTPCFKFVLPSDVKPGTYAIAKVGEVKGDIADIVLTGLEGHKGSLSYADGTISLTVAELREPSTVVWTGSEDNTWQLADKSNFKTQSDNKEDVFVSNDNVIFNDEASNGNVEITSQVTPATVTFDNANTGYTLTGESIIGTSSITKKGTGKANINNVNTFTGSVNINGGTLTANNLGVADGYNYGAFGIYSNTVNINGGTFMPTTTMSASHPIALGASGGVIETPKGVTLTLTNTITGTNNTLTKNGDGTLVLAPSASYGTLIVNGGEVRGQEASEKHGYPKTVVLNGGTLRDADDIYSYSTNSTNVEVPEGSTASWYLDSRCSYKGTLTGAGTLNVYATSTRNSIDGNWNRFAGQLNIGGSKTGSYDPVFLINNSNGLKNASVAANVQINNEGKNVALGNLSGNATLTGKGTWTIGARNEDVKYSGVINGGKITKTGSGTWTMSTPQSKVSGNVTVDGGVLNLNNTASNVKFFGNYDVTASGSGILAGRALLRNVYVNSGAAIQPGNYTSAIPTGTLKTEGSIYCYAGSSAKFFIYKKGTVTSLNVASTLSISGDIQVEAYKNYRPAAGDEFTLWTANKFSGTPAKITLPELPAGLEWDTTGLYAATGVIKVIVSTGISSISATEKFTGKVYTLSGMYVGEITTTKADAAKALRTMGCNAGVYIIRVGGEAVKISLK